MIKYKYKVILKYTTKFFKTIKEVQDFVIKYKELKDVQLRIKENK